MQRLWDTTMCQCCIWLPTESGYHPRSLIPHFATVFWLVSSLRPPRPTPPLCCWCSCRSHHAFPVVVRYDAQVPSSSLWSDSVDHSLGTPVRTCCWLPSFLQDSSPSHLFCTCLPLCPFLKCGISSSPADSSKVFLRQSQGWLPRLLLLAQPP